SEDPEASGNFLDNLNPDSLKIVTGYLEPSLADAPMGTHFQFERLGYFIRTDRGFNKAVGLKDSWAKMAQK
ncbi:MAG: glutamine--tRNA ligase, partial [Mucinivorans sp.]